MTKTFRNLQTVSDNGINALNLIGEKARGADYAKSKALLEMNYGVEYPKEKFRMLFDMMEEEGWTKRRLEDTVKWFLKNKKFPNWTVADWFEYGVKLYPYSKYLKELQQNQNLNNEIIWYKINGVILWKYKDDIELPFSEHKFTREAK